MWAKLGEAMWTIDFYQRHSTKRLLTKWHRRVYGTAYRPDPQHCSLAGPVDSVLGVIDVVELLDARLQCDDLASSTWQNILFLRHRRNGKMSQSVAPYSAFNQVYVYVCVSYLSIFPCLSDCQPVCLSIRLYVGVFNLIHLLLVFLSVFLSVSMSVHPWVFPSIHPSVFLSGL